MLKLIKFRSISSPCKHDNQLLQSRNSFRHYSALHNLRERSSGSPPLIFHSTSTDPYQNLAIEHYLLTSTDASSHVLFFYTNRPCIVIGRNQNPWVECNLKLLQDKSESSPIDLVRRRSGGGTVFHDVGNLNFSIITPNDKDFSRKKHAELVVRALKSAKTLIDHRTWDDIWVNERHDISITKEKKQYKVSGSAFKLTRGRALHHGTLLHSSPNLGAISRCLKSSGKEYIQAKGVESVRSPVSNLYNVTDDMRNKIRSTITQSIVVEYENLYGPGKEATVGQEDCEKFEEIMNGIQELTSNAWVFGQTPRFEYKSKTINGRSVTMSVNRANIEQASFTDQALPALHEIMDWAVLLEGFPIELVEHVSTIFPNMRSNIYSSSVIDSVIVERSEKKICRRLDGNTLEVEERGQNIVIDK